MGFYVNPPNETKEDFLNREGMRIPNQPLIEWEKIPKDHLPVVLIKNQFFSTAGIAYCNKELKTFTEQDDPRPKTIFLVKIEKLLPVSDLLKAKKMGLVAW